MKKITAKKYALSLYELTEDLSEKDISSLISGFVRVLLKNGDLKISNKVLNEFESVYNEKKGILKVEITTAKELSDSDKKGITSKLEAQLGKKVELEEVVDQSLIGGLKVKYQDKLVDGSIKTKLSLLKSKIV